MNGFEAAEVIVNREPPSAIGVTDFAEEAEWSRKYWSDEFADSSWDRMHDWSWPVGWLNIRRPAHVLRQHAADGVKALQFRIAVRPGLGAYSLEFAQTSGGSC